MPSTRSQASVDEPAGEAAEVAEALEEAAGCFFVVPADTVAWGWRCKLFSVVLEVFQLGALFPAAAFKHAACLRYMDPLNVPLGLVRTTIVAFGYACWGSLAARRRPR